MKKPPRFILLIVAIVAAVLVALLMGGLLLRNPIASFAATRVMASRGLSCNPVHVSIPFTIPPSPIELAPMRCELSEGVLQSIQFHEPLYVNLSAFSIALVYCASVTIVLHVRPHRDVKLNALGDITRIAGFDEPAVEFMFDTAQMSARKTPPFLASRATVFRGSRRIASLNDMRVTTIQAGLSISAQNLHINQVSKLGNATLQLIASPDMVLADVLFHSNLCAKVIAKHMRERRPNIRFEIGIDESRKHK